MWSTRGTIKKYYHSENCTGAMAYLSLSVVISSLFQERENTAVISPLADIQQSLSKLWWVWESPKGLLGQNYYSVSKPVSLECLPGTHSPKVSLINGESARPGQLVCSPLSPVSLKLKFISGPLACHFQLLSITQRTCWWMKNEIKGSSHDSS